MLIIGERINTSRKSIQRAVESKDGAFIKREAVLQAEAGASMLDINCGTSMERESSDIEWLIDTVQAAVDLPLCIDSPSPKVLGIALGFCRKRALINSITLEKGRFDAVVSLVKKYKAQVIALTMDESSMPKNAVERAAKAEKLLGLLRKEGVKDEDIFFDPLVKSIASEPDQAVEFLEAVARIKSLGKVKVVGGLSNVSFGLPGRHLLNSVFAGLAASRGIDAAIIDPLDKETMAIILAAETLAGRDEYCVNYIKAFREGRLEY